eukprot:238566_1
MSNKLTRLQVYKNNKCDIFINKYCFICAYQYSNNILWSNHRNTGDHLKKRSRLLDELPKKGKKRSIGASYSEPQKKKQKLLQKSNNTIINNTTTNNYNTMNNSSNSTMNNNNNHNTNNNNTSLS